MIVHQTHNSLTNYNYNAFIYRDCEWFYHFHKNYELTYVIDGEVELTLNGKKSILKKDSFALILPNEFHAYHTAQSSYVWIGVFSADFVKEFDKLAENKSSDTPIFHCEPAIRDYLLHYLIHEETPDILLLKSLLYSACREFLRHVTLSDSDKENNFIYDVISYVSDHFKEEISLISIANGFGYEYHYVSRQFHKQFGMNFRDYLNIYRIEYARELLLSSTESITAIAHSCGFQTMRTFNRAFIRHTGITPSDFRQTHHHPGN